MELVSHDSAVCCQLVSPSSKLVGKGSDLHRMQIQRCRKVDFLCLSLRWSRLAQLKLKKRKQRSGFRALDAFGGIQYVKSRTSSGFRDAYSAEGDQDATRVYESVEPGSQIVIPGLPDESEGEFGALISSCYWEWKPKFSVYYEKAGMENVDSPGVLFLPGFGVGSFHYEKQLKDLGRDFRVWALDFLGQGRSLPFEDPAPLSMKRDDESEGKDTLLWGFGDETEPWSSDLVYSVDLWRGQVQNFVEQVIGEPIYVVGNSLGGFVAVYFAASYPQLIKGVTLLNATPFWGFLPNPVRSPRLAKLFPWDGTFPLPANATKLTSILWQKISDPRSITDILKQVYSDSTKVENVSSRILETTEHPAAAASFASIMFAPRGQLSFSEALLGCQMNNVPICLMYGREDPWVTPRWGRKVKWQLPEVPYYEISPAGHCPHDEVPEVVNYLLRGWIKNVESNGLISLPLLDDQQSIQPIIYRELQFSRQDSKRSVRVWFYGTTFSLWKRVCSFIKYGFGSSSNTTKIQ